MTLTTICVNDYWHHSHYYHHDNQDDDDDDVDDACGTTTTGIGTDTVTDTGNKSTQRRMSLTLDAINANYLIRELLQQVILRQYLHRQYGCELLWIHLTPPPASANGIDYKWSAIVTQTIWEHVEVANLMSWLSTLGGGFSALGEQFERCAETAGKISLRQLQIGLKLGDEFLQARCKLYYSISLIQRGQLRAAKHVIREQYQFAIQHVDYDVRLFRMCVGIWQRLCYEYKERLQKVVIKSDHPS